MSRDLGQPRNQPGCHCLFELRCPEVVRRAFLHEPVDEVMVGPYPPDTQTSPHGLAERPDAHHEGFIGRLETAVLGSSIDVEVGGRLVDRQEGSRALCSRRDGLALVRRHTAARRVLEVGHEVGKGGAGASEGLGDALEIPSAFGRYRDADEPPAGATECVGCMRIRGGLDRDAIAASDEHARKQVDRALGTGGDHDLARLGRQSPSAEQLGDGFAQLSATEDVVPRARGEGRGIGRNLGHVTRKPGPSWGARLLEVDGAVSSEHPRDLAPAERKGDASRPPQAADVPGVAKALIGHRDGAATDSKCGGEFALSRKRGPGRDAVVQAEQTDAVGERLVSRFARAPSAQCEGQ